MIQIGIKKWKNWIKKKRKIKTSNLINFKNSQAISGAIYFLSLLGNHSIKTFLISLFHSNTLFHPDPDRLYVNYMLSVGATPTRV